jgi:hypothetical protein
VPKPDQPPASPATGRPTLEDGCGPDGDPPRRSNRAPDTSTVSASAAAFSSSAAMWRRPRLSFFGPQGLVWQPWVRFPGEESPRLASRRADGWTGPATNFGSTLGGTCGRQRGAADHQSSSNWAWAGNFKRNQADGTRTGPPSKAMFLKLQCATADGSYATSRPDRARPRRRPSTIFRPRSDGVTGYVTSSHGGNAVALRRNGSFGRKSAGAVETGNGVADEQADRFNNGLAGVRFGEARR